MASRRLQPSNSRSSSSSSDDDNDNNDGDNDDPTAHMRAARPSLALTMVRHAESANNEVYRNARYIFRGGTDAFDRDGCRRYVEAHRAADPCLSERGDRQAEALAGYLVPHLENQASSPVRVLCSPMRRALLTIKPTLERLHLHRRLDAPNGAQGEAATTTATTATAGSGPHPPPAVHIVVVASYHETEGCHLRGVPEPGMTPSQIRHLLGGCVASVEDDIEFVGFDGPDVGWYAGRAGQESRADSEARAARYCLWLSEYVDQQLHYGMDNDDLFDAGVVVEGEDQEDEHDKHEVRVRRRRTTLAVGHGDFMSTVLKRLVTGFGHMVESEGSPHRSAFAHFNTGLTELECFGSGRFLVMGTNQTPHIPPHLYRDLRSGGTLRDGWSFLVPPILDAQVEVVFSDDELDDHVREQTDALKALYLSSADYMLQPAPRGAKSATLDTSCDAFEVEEEQEPKNLLTHFLVKRGLQVVGVATYSEDTGRLTDVAIRPSAALTSNRGTGVKRSGDRDGDGGDGGVSCAETLIRAVKSHARKMGRSESLIVTPRSKESLALFAAMGFSELDGDDAGGDADSEHQVLSSVL